MTQGQTEKIMSVLEGSNYAVIATVGDGLYPQSAVMTISSTSDSRIVFCSSYVQRKNHNIQLHPQVSCAVGWDAIEKKTLQIEGEARCVVGDERKLLEEAHCAKHPGFLPFLGNPEQEYFVIEPVWIRYSDLSQSPKESWEINLRH